MEVFGQVNGIVVDFVLFSEITILNESRAAVTISPVPCCSSGVSQYITDELHKHRGQLKSGDKILITWCKFLGVPPVVLVWVFVFKTFQGNA